MGSGCFQTVMKKIESESAPLFRVSTMREKGFGPILRTMAV
jgi:hypothetical protein